MSPIVVPTNQQAALAPLYRVHHTHYQNNDTKQISIGTLSPHFHGFAALHT